MLIGVLQSFDEGECSRLASFVQAMIDSLLYIPVRQLSWDDRLPRSPRGAPAHAFPQMIEVSPVDGGLWCGHRAFEQQAPKALSVLVLPNQLPDVLTRRPVATRGDLIVHEGLQRVRPGYAQRRHAANVGAFELVWQGSGRGTGAGAMVVAPRTAATTYGHRAGVIRSGGRQLKIIVEKHPEGYVAYPLGLKGVVVGQGDTYQAALDDVRSAIAFHVQTFGEESLTDGSPAIDAFVAESGVAI